LRPDFGALERVEARGVIVTSRGDAQEFDFVSRFFAPRTGILEDPVTGSAHCALTPFWSERLHKTEMTAYQASPRGGVVWGRRAWPRGGSPSAATCSAWTRGAGCWWASEADSSSPCSSWPTSSPSRARAWLAPPPCCTRRR